MKLKDIYEMSIAGYGDWNISPFVIDLVTITILKLKYDKITTLSIRNRSFDLYKLKISNKYILGNVISSKTEKNEYAFEMVLEIKLEEEPKIAKSLGLTKLLYRVDNVRVDPEQFGQGFASSIYQFFVDIKKFVIIGDAVQYFGARKLWAKLSKNSKLIVDIIDLIDMKYLDKNVKIFHGFEDSEFDERIWSYDIDKEHIRLLLTSIKD